MSQDYLARIAALEDALRQKDSQLSLVAETESFLRSALARAEEKIENEEREIEYLRAQIEKLRRMLFGTRSEKLRRQVEEAEALLKQYEGKEACQIIPDGTFPELLRFGPQKEYLRKVLKTTMLNTAVQDDPAIPVETLTKDAPYYAYQAAVCPDAARVASHQVIEEHIGTSGKDYRFEEKPHPVEALRDRTQDNTTIARGKI